MSIPIALSLTPKINKVLDSRTSGSSGSRPQFPARGLLRHEHDSPVKWVYYTGTEWVPFEESLFATSNPTDYVQNSVGAIAAGTSVETLREMSITQLLTDLLRIAPEPEIIFNVGGISIGYVNSNAEFEVGTTASVALSLRINRGHWGGGVHMRYPAIGTIDGAPKWGGLSMSVTSQDDFTFTLTSDENFTRTFTDLQDIHLPQNGEISVLAGPVYTNNYGTEYQSNSRTFTTVSNAPMLRSYLSIFLDDIALPTHVYVDTTHVQIDAHESSEIVSVPYAISEVKQYESFGAGDPWRLLSSDDYTISSTVRNGITYHNIELTFTRGPADIRIHRQLALR